MQPRMSRRFWVTSSLVRRPLIFCCVSGGTPRSEMLLVGYMGVPVAKRGTSASRFRQNSGISLPGFCFTVVLGPGTCGTAGRPNVTARRNSRGSPG